MPPFNKYHYEPLCADDSIRLIVLNSAKDVETPPICSIIQRRRSELQGLGVEYHAISYAWGKQEFSHNLEIKYRHDVSYLRITSNVNTILRHLRARNGKSRYMWIDAICLNQDDETEKAHQIRNMGCIYRDAKQVDIWLGLREQVVTSRVIDFFKEASSVPGTTHNEVSEIIVRLIMKHIPSEDPTGIFRAPGFRDVVSFFEASWFTRRWVIQEACLARHALVHCGKDNSIRLTVLRQAAVKFLHLDVSSYEINMTTYLHMPTAKLNILECLWKFHEAACLEPRDRVASLLGLVSDRDGFDINYSAPWTEIYHTVASSSLSSGRKDVGLQVLLHLFEFGPIAQPGYPRPASWVPDWSRSRIRKLPYHSRRRNVDALEEYPCSPGNPAIATIDFNQGCPQVYSQSLSGGSRGGRVCYTTTLDPATNGQKPGGRKAIDALTALLPSQVGPRPRATALVSLIRTTANFKNIQHRSPESSAELKAMETLETLLEECCLFEVEPLNPTPNEGNRAFGFCSKQIEVGDVVIPLWRPEPDTNTEGIDDIYTMLVVRYTGKHCSKQHGSDGGLDRRTSNQVPQAVVIGPSICVPTVGNRQSESPARPDADLSEGREYCVCLV